MRRTFLLLVAFPALLGAQPPTRASARADHGFSAERLRRVDSYLQQQVDSNRIAGGVALVLRDGKLTYQRAVGWADKESGRRMTPDAMFRIASQTKVYGYNTDILGCVVEIVAGMPLDVFIRTRITGPLSMTDTHFFVPEAQRERLVAVYASDTNDRAARAPDGARGQGHYLSGPRRNHSGGAGLVSTAHDYARLLQMLLNGGVLDGVRILSPRTVALMTTNQTGTLYPSNGQGFGLGFSVIERLGADNSLLSVGTYGWAGAYGSQYRVDPSERVVLVFMLNQMPNRTDVAAKFPTLVYQALTTIRD